MHIALYLQVVSRVCGFILLVEWKWEYSPEGIASISLLPSQYALALARPGRAACRQVKTATSCTEPMGHTHRNLSSRSADIPVGIASSIPRSANQAP